MLLERTISQLDIGPVPPDRARELGHLGFMQWLGWLPAGVNYPHAALHALTVAAPFASTSPAVAVFCDLLIASTAVPPQPLDLELPPHHRRGGRAARRGAL
ncbi:MAG: hypothetical protein AAF914_00050 [Pseudomonadota bacterium]